MMQELHSYYFKQAEPIKSCLFSIRSIVLQQDKNITETVKYGMPCFCYRRKTFCYLWADKKTNSPYLLMVDGNYLYHPKLEKGNRTKMKILRIDPAKDLPVNTMKDILQESLDLNRRGVLKINV